MTISLTSAGQARLTELSGQLLKAPAPANELAVVVSGRVMLAPQMLGVIPGDMQLSGVDLKTVSALLDALD